MAINYAGKNLIGYGKAQVYKDDGIAKQARQEINAVTKGIKDRAAAKAKAAAKAAKLKKKRGDEIQKNINSIDWSKLRNPDVSHIKKNVDGVNDFYFNNTDEILAGGAAYETLMGMMNDVTYSAGQSILEKEVDENYRKHRKEDPNLRTAENDVALDRRFTTSIFDDGWNGSEVESQDDAATGSTTVGDVVTGDATTTTTRYERGAGEVFLTPNINEVEEFANMAAKIKPDDIVVKKGDRYSIGNGNNVQFFETKLEADKAAVVQSAKAWINHHSYSPYIQREVASMADEAGQTEDEYLFNLWDSYIDKDPGTVSHKSAPKAGGGKEVNQFVAQPIASGATYIVDSNTTNPTEIEYKTVLDGFNTQISETASTGKSFFKLETDSDLGYQWTRQGSKGSQPIQTTWKNDSKALQIEALSIIPFYYNNTTEAIELSGNTIKPGERISNKHIAEPKRDKDGAIVLPKNVGVQNYIQGVTKTGGIVITPYTGSHKSAFDNWYNVRSKNDGSLEKLTQSIDYNMNTYLYGKNKSRINNDE